MAIEDVQNRGADHSDRAKDIPKIAVLSASEQREAFKHELERVKGTSGAEVSSLVITRDKDKSLAIISKEGKPVEVIDEAGKIWKSDGKNLFSDGQNQRLLAPKIIDGKPAKNTDGTRQYDFMQAQTRQDDNKDGTKRQIVTQITDGDGRKWASVDGQNFIGAAGANGAGQAGEQRVLKDNNSSLEFTDPKGGALSEEAINGKEQEIQNLIKQNSYYVPQDVDDANPFNFNSANSGEQVDGRKLNEVLENSSPESLARFEKDLNLRASMKDKMDATDYEHLTRILDGSSNINAARADRIFANGTGNSGVDAKPAEQEVQRLMLQTNAADMPKLNDALLNRINADPTQKKQYEQYLDQHKNDAGFDLKNAALIAFSKNFSKKTQDAMPMLTKGNDQLDTAIGGVTPRQQMLKQALDNKDFDLFKTAVTGAPAEARAEISRDAVDGAFSNLEWTSTANDRNLDIAHDLVGKGQIQTATEIKYSNVDQADKILANLTPEQRASYNQGKDVSDPDNRDRRFYSSMQDAMKTAANGDAAKLLRLDDEARKKDGSYIATMTDHEHWAMNDWSQAVANKLDTMTADQRKDMADNYNERRKQMSDMVTALYDDPNVVLEKFDQMFKKAKPDADISAAALASNIHAVQSKLYPVIGDEAGSGDAAGRAEAVAKTMQSAFVNDPELFNRLKNPQTDSEKELAGMFKDQDNLFGHYKDSYGSLVTDGRLPLSQALPLDRDNFSQTAKDVLSASPEDQKNFLSHPDEAKLSLSNDQYALMANILQQHKMQPEDEARAVAIGWNMQDDLKSLSGFDADIGANYQKKYGEDLQVSLLNKYGHQDASVNDFLSKYNNVFQKTDDLSHESAVAGSGWASKLLDGTGSMTPQEMNVAATQMADMSAKFQKQLDTAPDSVKPEMQAFIDSQKRLKDAVDSHDDATKQLADTADKAVSLAAMAVAIGVTGGAALPEAMALISAEAAANIAGGAMLASGAGRLALRQELLGPNWKDKDREKDSLDIAIDTAAQFGATKLLKVADVLKGMKAGAAMTAATRAQLESLGLSKRAVGVLEVGMEKAPSPASVVAGAADAAPTTTAAKPVTDEVAKHAALPKPTGVNAVAVTGQPAVPGTDSADVLKATPEAFAKLSPGSKEFLFQMAQLGGIGAVDAKLKGESAVEGAAQWMAMGAAVHGALAGLERSGITMKMSQSAVRQGEILDPGEMPAHAPENHELFEITTGNGTKIVNENGKYTVNGKPAEVKLNKVGDDYHVDYRMHDGPADTWTRFDQKNPNGTKFMNTDVGERFEKNSDGHLPNLEPFFPTHTPSFSAFGFLKGNSAQADAVSNLQRDLGYYRFLNSDVAPQSLSRQVAMEQSFKNPGSDPSAGSSLELYAASANPEQVSRFGDRWEPYSRPPIEHDPQFVEQTMARYGIGQDSADRLHYGLSHVARQFKADIPALQRQAASLNIATQNAFVVRNQIEGRLMAAGVPESEIKLALQKEDSLVNRQLAEGGQPTFYKINQDYIAARAAHVAKVQEVSAERALRERLLIPVMTDWIKNDLKLPIRSITFDESVTLGGNYSAGNIKLNPRWLDGNYEVSRIAEVLHHEAVHLAQDEIGIRVALAQAPKALVGMDINGMTSEEALHLMTSLKYQEMGRIGNLDDDWLQTVMHDSASKMPISDEEAVHAALVLKSGTLNPNFDGAVEAENAARVVGSFGRKLDSDSSLWETMDLLGKLAEEKPPVGNSSLATTLFDGLDQAPNSVQGAVAKVRSNPNWLPDAIDFEALHTDLLKSLEDRLGHFNGIAEEVWTTYNQSLLEREAYVTSAVHPNLPRKIEKDGKLLEVYHENGRSIKYGYDSDGNLARASFSSGDVTIERLDHGFQLVDKLANETLLGDASIRKSGALNFLLSDGTHRIYFSDSGYGEINSVGKFTRVVNGTLGVDSKPQASDFTYDDSGALMHARLFDGRQYARNADDTWTELEGPYKGTIYPAWNVEVGVDGSILSPHGPDLVLMRPDGTTQNVGH